ncbi:hypothetical protein ACHAXR_013473 [Thalassiosira sp. AJA248-18]
MTTDSSGIGPAQLSANQATPKLGQPYIQSVTTSKGKKNPNDDDDDDANSAASVFVQGGSQKRRAPWSSVFRSMDGSTAQTSSSMILSGMNFGTICIRAAAVATMTLYVLNQKHMLPMPMGKAVSKLLFWPTLPITVSRRIGKWTTVVDNAVVLGGAPFGFCGYPEKLSRQFNVRGVINMCDEYRGPVGSYKRYGIEHLRLPTVDHFEPSVEDLKKAVAFIQKHESQGGRVYVHCRAGHGRSAAAVYAWLLYKEPLADPVELNEKLCSMRNVRKSLWKQPNVNIFRVWLQNGGMMSDSDSDSDSDDYSWSSQQNKKHGRRGRPESDTDDSDSDDSIIYSKIGHVFSSDEDSSEENELYYDVEYDDDISEDDKDYEMWRNYQSDEF